MVFLILLVINIVALLALTFWIGAKGEKQLELGSGFPEGKDMVPFMYLGMFYINPSDPRGWLPKSNPGFGWTINFRNRGYANLFIVLLVSTLLFTIGVLVSLV